MVKHGVFGIFSKTALRIFLISCQNIKLNSAFQPAKTVHEKKKKIRSEVISGQRCTEAQYWMILFFIFISCSKMLRFCWNFQKIIVSCFEMNYGSFRSFDQISFVSAQIIIIEWSFSYNLISCSKMMRIGSKF